MYYQAKDLEALDRLMQRFWRNMVLIALVPLAMAAVSCLVRFAPLGYLGTVLLAVIAVVGWFGVGQPIARYRRLVRDILMNRERTAEGTVIDAKGEVQSRNGSKFVPLRLEAHDQETGERYERIVLFDTLKGEVPVQEGQHARFTLYDNVIKGVEILEECP